VTAAARQSKQEACATNIIGNGENLTLNGFLNGPETAIGSALSRDAKSLHFLKAIVRSIMQHSEDTETLNIGHKTVVGRGNVISVLIVLIQV